MASKDAPARGGLRPGEVEDEVTYTDAQWAALKAAQTFILTKYRGRLVCNIVGSGFMPRPMMSVSWEGHDGSPKDRVGTNMPSTGEGPKPPVHNSFGEYLLRR